MLRAPTALVTLLLFTFSVSSGLASEPTSTIRVVKKKPSEAEAPEEEEAKKPAPVMVPQPAPPTAVSARPAPPPPVSARPAPPPPVSARPTASAPSQAGVTRAAERPLELTPQAQAPKAPVAAVQTASPRSPSIVPFVALAGSFVAGVFGVVFAVRTAKLLNDDSMDLELQIDNPKDGAKVVVPDEFKDHQSRILGNGLTATLLLSGAVSGIVASIIVLASD